MATSKVRPSMRVRAWSTVAAVLTDLHPRSASMSSMSMRTIISSSTTRMRRPESGLSNTGGLRCGNVDRASQAVRPEVQMHHGVQLMGETTLDHLRAETLVGRSHDRRSVLLLPAQD